MAPSGGPAILAKGGGEAAGQESAARGYSPDARDSADTGPRLFLKSVVRAGGSRQEGNGGLLDAVTQEG